MIYTQLYSFALFADGPTFEKFESKIVVYQFLHSNSSKKKTEIGSTIYVSFFPPYQALNKVDAGHLLKKLVEISLPRKHEPEHKTSSETIETSHTETAKTAGSVVAKLMAAFENPAEDQTDAPEVCHMIHIKFYKYIFYHVLMFDNNLIMHVINFLISCDYYFGNNNHWFKKLKP